MIYRINAVATLLIAGAAVPCVAQAPWTVDARPLTDIKGPAVAAAFASPVSAVRLANGNIVVADAVPGGGAVHFFDTNGKLVRTAGHPGDGAGEFRYIGWIGRCVGDSVLAWDLRHRRMTVFDGLGIVIREYRIPAENSTEPSPVKVTCASTGVIAYQPTTRTVPPPAATPLVRGNAPVTIDDPRRKSHVKTAALAGDDEMIVGGAIVPRPFGRTTSLGLATDRLYVGTADSSVIEVFGLDGRRMPSVTLPVPKQAVPPAAYQRAVSALVARAMPAMRDTVRKTLARLPAPDRLPPYQGILVDPDDLLWAVLSAPDEAVTRLCAIDKSGHVTNVRLPAAMRVTAIGRDFILGISNDAKGVEHVLMYRLHRGS